MTNYTQTSSAPQGPDTKADLLARVRNCFKIALAAEAKQREREKEDLRFQVPENQWERDALAQREGGVVGGVQTPPRPVVSISLLAQPMQLVQNQLEAAQLGVNIHPVSEKANQETAEVFQDYYRQIERDSEAGVARAWAFDRAKQCGTGWYRVTTEYDEDGDDELDQVIKIEWILYQESVYIDPAATKPDYSDAKWALVVQWMTEEDVKAAYPGSSIATTGFDAHLMEVDAPDWVNATDQRPYAVAEYWFKDIKRKPLRGGRTKEDVTVYCAKVCGSEVLEEPQEWNGKHIPLIPVIGRRLQPVDGEVRKEGMVRPARDAQRGYNYAISAAVEDVGRISKAPYVTPDEAVQGYEAEWASANYRNLPYLRYKTKDGQGQPLQPPQPMPVDGTKMQLSLALADVFKGAVQATTAVFEPSLGQMPTKREAQSGRAIQALQQQSDAGTSHYMRNLVIAMRYEARVVLDLAAKILDRPGRIIRGLGPEGDSRTMMLNAPYVKGEGGMPQRVRSRKEPGAKYHSFAEGKYNISIDIGKSFQTRLEEGGQMLGEVLAKEPSLTPLVGPTFFRFQDWPGAKDIADILLKVRNQQYPFLAEGDEENSPEAAQAKMQALSQQVQQMGQQLQQATMALQTKQAEQQAKVQAEQIRAQADLQVQQMKADLELAIAQANNAAKIEIARIQAAQAALDTAAAAQEERLSTGLKIRAEMAQTAVEHEHEERMAQQQHAHEMVSHEAEQPPPQPGGGA